METASPRFWCSALGQVAHRRRPLANTGRGASPADAEWERSFICQRYGNLLTS